MGNQNQNDPREQKREPGQRQQEQQTPRRDDQERPQQPGQRRQDKEDDQRS